MPLKGRDAVDKMIAKNRVDSNTKLRGVFFAGLSAIIKATPVDEGRARNNWFLSVGVPFSLTSGRGDSKSGSGSLSSLNEMPKNILNKKVYYTNNMPYIEDLEYGGFPDPVKLGSYDKKKKVYVKKSGGGFSKQAPGGWVRKQLIRMGNKVRSL
jgi:hypothetical protein